MKSKKYVLFPAAGFVVVCLMLGVYLTLGGDTRKGSPDDLVGWYELEAGRTVIPVFQYDEGYYSTSGWGFEVPLKECPEGLKIDRWPLHLIGTTIGFDRESNEYYLELKDSRGHIKYEFGTPGRQKLTRIDRPSWIIDPETEPPQTNDDFLGWYQPAWCLWLRTEIRKEGDLYIGVSQVCDRLEGAWRPDGDPSIRCYRNTQGERLKRN